MIKRRLPLIHILFLLGFFLALRIYEPLSAWSQVVGVDSVGITVSDMERSVDFYTEVLGFTKVSDVELQGPEYEKLFGVFGLRVRIVKLRLGEEFVDLIEFIAPSYGEPVPIDSKSNDLWFQHIAIIVSDMDGAYEILREHNVRQISTGPQTIPESNKEAAGIRALKFLDPDGHPLELLWFPPDKGDPRWHKKTDKLFLGIDHTAIGVSDSEDSIKFYKDLLGIKVAGGGINKGTEQEHLDGLFGATVRITGLRAADQIPGIEFLEYKTPPGGRPMPINTNTNDLWHWQTRLIVDDLESVTASLGKEKVSFVSSEVVDLPDDKIGFKKGIMILDPDRHAVVLIEK